MNNWNVIECYDGFIAITSEQWNETPEYKESWLIRSGLTRDPAIALAIKLNNAIEEWEKHNGL